MNTTPEVQTVCQSSKAAVVAKLKCVRRRPAQPSRHLPQ